MRNFIYYLLCTSTFGSYQSDYHKYNLRFGKSEFVGAKLSEGANRLVFVPREIRVKYAKALRVQVRDDEIFDINIRFVAANLLIGLLDGPEYGQFTQIENLLTDCINRVPIEYSLNPETQMEFAQNCPNHEDWTQFGDLIIMKFASDYPDTDVDDRIDKYMKDCLLQTSTHTLAH